MMARVYVSVGSNMQREINIAAALVALRDLLGNVIESPVYESESVGFKGENFFNLVVVGDTEKSIGDLTRSLAQIEARQGACAAVGVSGRAPSISICCCTGIRCSAPAALTCRAMKSPNMPSCCAAGRHRTR